MRWGGAASGPPKPHAPTLHTFTQQPGGYLYFNPQCRPLFSIGNLGPKREMHFHRPRGTWEDTARAGPYTGFRIPRPELKTNHHPPECPCCSAADQPLWNDPPKSPTLHPDAPIWRLSGHSSVASGMNFIGHVVGQAVVWEHWAWGPEPRH